MRSGPDGLPTERVRVSGINRPGGRHIATMLRDKGRMILVWGLAGHWSTRQRRG